MADKGLTQEQWDALADDEKTKLIDAQAAASKKKVVKEKTKGKKK